MDKNVTKEGIIVAPGQVWEDLDKRIDTRHLRIISVTEGRAKAQRCSPAGEINPAYHPTTISVSRMHKGATGYALVATVTPLV